MGKKAREFRSGDFIFAKVKGYPAWPARVQRLNGKKYFVYFYGTGETANLPSNMIFDYAENKDKFLTKTQKRRDFNDGVRQIEHDFTNNVPLEEVVGVPVEAGEAPADETANDSAINDVDETLDTTANETADDETLNTTQADGAVEDSDENGALVIDEGKATKKKAPKETPKTPATPKAKEAKTLRGKAKKEAEDEEEKKEDEVVSRSGRKIRPKRFVDEQTEDNATLPSPAPKKQRRGASPAVVESEKEIPEPRDKNIRSYNAVTQSELEELKQPFRPADAEKENILIAYLPGGKYVGIKLFQSRPVSFKNEAARLQWDKQAASNAITLRMQLERGQIVADSIQGQLVMDLNLNAEEKETLDKERETEEKKSRVQFLITEMRFIEIDSQIKTCLSLEKADTDLCLKLMDEMLELDMKPLILLKHPSCLETVKRLRNYVGNTPRWDLTEEAALAFNKQAHRIRKQADQAYKNFKKLFVTPDGLSFYEYFQERVQTFNTLCEALDATELLELVHEPLGLSQPSSTTMVAAIEAANKEDGEEESPKKRAKAIPKKAATPAKSKRQTSRKQVEQDKADEPTAAVTDAVDTPKEPEPIPETVETAVADVAKETDETAPAVETSEAQEKTDKPAKKGQNAKEGKRSQRNAERNAKADKEAEKVEKAAEKVDKEAEKVDKEAEKLDKEAEKLDKEAEKLDKEAEKLDKEAEKVDKEAEKVDKEAEKVDKVAENEEKPAETANETDKTDDTEKVANSSKDEENSKVADVAEENAKDVVNNIENDVEMAEVINTTPKKNTKKAAKNGAKTPKCDKNAKDSALNNEEAVVNENPAETTPDTAENKLVTKSPKKSAKDEKIAKDSEQNDLEKIGKDAQKNGKDTNSPEKRKIAEDKAEEKKEETAEPRAKRSRESRENKKTEAPPPRSPARRKAKN